ncbi:uncharacterized protein [Eurosta solidaginis]|uniref:uncharacterized protein n=1 Tax=Eurosta solidaginis TaxID=178769 RepID=UPI003530A468
MGQYPHVYTNLRSTNHMFLKMLSIESICLLATLFGIVYAWLRYTYGYWKRHGIPFMKPLPLVGNATVMFTRTKSFLLYISDVYDDPKMSKEAVVGIYLLSRPALVLREPELIKSVMIKQFQKFPNRIGDSDPVGDPLGAKNLFFQHNPQWKEQRTKLTPMYTAAKIKQLYLLMREIGAELEAHLHKQGKSCVTEVKEICALFTTDLIATTAFGIQAHSFENPNSEFRTHARKFFEVTITRALSFMIAFFYPKWVSTLKIKLFNPEFSAFLRNTIADVMSAREKSNGTRNDLIDVLLEMKKEFVANGEYDEGAQDALIAQAGLFFTAGFETSSTTMSFALYELAKHPAMQGRLRNEICDAFIAENSKLSYETITTLPYLSMVIDETLRMYPVAPALDRVHSPDEGEDPFDLKPYNDYTLPKDMPVFIPVYGLQHDPKYWPNPETFDPERFTPENKKLHEPMAYLPFGAGPRNCIGNRLGLLQSKLGLAHILKNHCVKFCDKTPAEMKFDPMSIGLTSKVGIYLNIVNDELYEQRLNRRAPLLNANLYLTLHNNNAYNLTYVCLTAMKVKTADHALPTEIALTMTAYSCCPLLTVVLLSIVATLIQLWFKHRYNYWSRLKVPYLKPNIFLGNLKPLLTLSTSFGDYFRTLYAEPCFHNAPYFGFFILQTPALLLRDPQLIEQVLIKEFNNFPNRYEAADLHTDPMGALTLPLAKYSIWSKSRREISNLFTSGHIKQKMYPRLVKIAEQLEAYIIHRMNEGGIEVTSAIIEVKEMCALYTTDVTAVLMYGIDTAGLQNNGCEMREQCENLFTPTPRKIVDFFTIFFLPKSVRLLTSKVFTRQYENYMRRLVEQRLKTGHLISKSEDLIDLLLKMQQTLDKTTDNNWLQHPDFIAAQVGVFLLAGFETSSSLLGFILYELAKQPRVQRKLRKEIVRYYSRVRYNGISYGDVLGMLYLNMIVSEGLRLYPTAPFINRECLPNDDQEQTLWYGKKRNCLRIPKYVPAYVSILGLHRDPKYWPNPKLFDPQRFAPENLPSIKPMTYIPFGAGPHGCVGSRLGILQVKLGLVYILRRYRVEMCEKTVTEIKFDPKRFMLEANGGIYLKFVKDDGR